MLDNHEGAIIWRTSWPDCEAKGPCARSGPPVRMYEARRYEVRTVKLNRMLSFLAPDGNEYEVWMKPALWSLDHHSVDTRRRRLQSK